MKPHPIVLAWDHNGRLRSVCDCDECQPGLSRSEKLMVACAFVGLALLGLVVLWRKLNS